METAQSADDDVPEYKPFWDAFYLMMGSWDAGQDDLMQRVEAAILKGLKHLQLQPRPDIEAVFPEAAFSLCRIDPVIVRALKSFRAECFDDSEFGIAIDKFLAEQPKPAKTGDE